MKEVKTMVIMSDSSKRFLEKNCPSALDARTINEALEIINDNIVEKGFCGRNNDEYNDYGRKAQAVFDDIYFNATEQ